MKPEFYTITLRPLAKDEGGGWVAQVPDLPGCMGDGDSEEEALRNVRHAITSWIATAENFGKTIPRADSPSKFVLRLSRSLHERLTSTAARDGISLNTEVIQLIAEGLGRRSSGNTRAKTRAKSSRGPRQTRSRAKR